MLTLSHFLGPDSFFQHDFAEPWAHELERATNGAVRVKIYNNTSPHGDVTKQAWQVEQGKVDIALGLRGAEGDRFPRSSTIELPFIVSSAREGSRALWNLHKDGDLSADFKALKVLALFVHNPGLIHTTVKRIISPDDLKGQRLRAPNATVAAALGSIGATPVVLQVNDVMPAVRDGTIDGIVTNWGNPLPDFDRYMKYHTDIAFYTSVFFVVMNRHRFDHLPPHIQTAIETVSNEKLVTRFGLLWDKWDRLVRDGAAGPGQEILVPDAALLAQWHHALRPFTEQYLDELTARGFTNARAVYAKLLETPTL
ncbi:MAG TPA: TRAP transporter substrate-binding protein [Acetobacteraceae bacterium]|nr:TRAP transporter substrate-binding protein [Acetobacteraceae bacterium]